MPTGYARRSLLVPWLIPPWPGPLDQLDSAERHPLRSAIPEADQDQDPGFTYARQQDDPLRSCRHTSGLVRHTNHVSGAQGMPGRYTICGTDDDVSLPPLRHGVNATRSSSAAHILALFRRGWPAALASCSGLRETSPGERMKGLEPSTFCMARVGGRSRRFACVRRNLSFAAASVRASERRRTRANADCSHCSHCDSRHVQGRC